MKIIISYASAGAGHFKAAEAIYNYFRKNNPNIEVKLVDALEYSHRHFKNAYIHGYTFIVNYAHWLWGFLFYVTYLKLLRPLTQRLNFFINRLNTIQFAKFLSKENPTFIISTHFLPSAIASYLKKKELIQSRLITVITDFGVHPFWLAEATDIYIVASDFTKQQLMREGIEEERIKVLGIPIDEKFSRSYDKDSLCRKIGLDRNKFTPLETIGKQEKDKVSLTGFTVLVVTGSFGIGPIEEIVALLYKDVQILVVCAKNKRLFIRLSNKNYPNVKVFGFVDNIEELMAISDIVISKPGGLSISELLSMERPPLFISAIPGQEAENVKILARYGIGLEVKNIRDIKDIVLDYKANPDKISQIKENIRKIKKPSAAWELYNAICQSSIGVTY